MSPALRNGLLGAAALLLVWEAIARLLGTEIAPTAVASAAVGGAGVLAMAVLRTLWQTLAGTVIAVFLGGLAGIAMARSGLGAERAPAALGVAPKLALAPLLAVVFIGVTDQGAILLAVLAAFAPVASAVSRALAAVPRAELDVLKGLGADHGTLLRRLVLPRAAPGVLAALPMAVVLALAGTVLAELISPQGRGLGARLLAARIAETPALTLAVLAVILALGQGLHAGASRLARRYGTPLARRLV